MLPLNREDRNAHLSGVAELPPAALRRPCDPAALGFETTDDLPRLQGVIGQPRALRALELGSAVAGPGFNIFALGLPDSGRTNLIRVMLERKAAAEPTPDDWCYVNNFDDAQKPIALHLPAGRAREFRADMRALIESCERDIPRAFESEGFTKERERLLTTLKNEQDAGFARLTEFAARHNLAIGRGPMGFVVMPMLDGEPIRPEDAEKLTPEQIAEFERAQASLKAEIEQSIERLRDIERVTRELIQQLEERTALYVVDYLLAALRAKYAGMDGIPEYLEAVKADLVSHAGQFRTRESASGGADGSVAALRQRYAVNVLVDNAALHGAPVIVESQPSYHNLLGRIEHQIVMGASQTDFTQIRPGAIHRANGGYLILPARDVLLSPYAWEGLKRVLRDGVIRIVELGTQLSLLSTATLEPETIPLSVKIVLIGTPLLYYLLNEYDEDFAKLFKVKAEFATSMPRTPETEREYGLFARSVVDDNRLLPFDCSAVARLVEHGSRMVDDQGRLSTRFGKIADLIREASYWASKDGQKRVTAAAVQRAIDEGIYRSNLLEERLQDLIAQGTLMIDVSGQAVGQINALSVLMLGDYAFGHPSRVTASARPGQGGVIDIERRAELGGPIHTKGVLIITGLLGARYGRKMPLSLSASLAFEQSYQGVEGDSASAAELLALLSAISGVPLRQDCAVTGSINQHGQIQAIGGVNEKIEGFFAICKLRGFTGTQGVIIPAANARNLMLREEVVSAVAAGQFHIWPIKTVDDGLALLTGREPGVPDAEGNYAEGTVNHAVMAKLAEFARTIKSVMKDEVQPAEMTAE